MLRTIAPDVCLAQAGAADAAYLYDLVERTMCSYVEATWGGWREAETRDTLSKAAAEGRYSLIHVGDQVVGAVCVERHATHIQLEQLYVEPQHQRRGIGTTIVRDILAEAGCSKLPVRLRVLAVNPARELYARLGFVVTKRTPERLFMEHHA
jgi:GNAT superfamily N-acetyltransferase